MNLNWHGPSLILAAKLCAAAVAAVALAVVSLSAIGQNQEVTDTTETETMLPDGRTLAEWLLEADVLLDAGHHTRALVESSLRSREVGNIPSVLEVQEQALSSLRAEIATQIGPSYGLNIPKAIRALRRIKRIEAVAGQRPWLLQAKARANWMIGDYPAEVAALDLWLEAVPKSHPDRKCVESARSLAEAAIPQSTHFFDEVGHLPSPLRGSSWNDVHYASALDLEHVIAALLIDPTTCNAESHDRFVHLSEQTEWVTSDSWEARLLRKRIAEIPDDVKRFLDTHGGTPCSTTASCKKILRFLNRRPGGFSNSGATASAQALTIAVLANARNAAVKLLDLGAAVNPPSNISWYNETNRNTSLYWAVVMNLPDMVKLLIEYGADVDGRESMHPPPLHSAVEANLPDIAWLLMEAGADADLTDYKCRSPLVVAALENHLEIAKLLVDHYDADVNGPAIAGCTTPLLAAAVRNHYQMARFFVDRGASFDDGRHLLAAVEAHAFDVAEFLIGRGANVEAKHKGEPLLHVLAKRNDIEGVQFFLNRHADVNSRTMDSFARTPLMVAVIEGHIDLAELLIRRGAEVNTTDEFGYTPLHLAARRGNSSLVELLVKNGADSSIQDDDGQTPAALALEAGHTSLALVIQPRPFFGDLEG